MAVSQSLGRRTSFSFTKSLAGQPPCLAAAAVAAGAAPGGAGPRRPSVAGGGIAVRFQDHGCVSLG